MKLHYLLQKCSFFLIKLAAFQASGAARVKLCQNGIVFFLIRLVVFSGQRRRSYETTPKWHDFLVINPVALAADSRAEKRTAEYRMSNNE